MAISVRRKHHTYVIAEAGVNHNGDIKMARRLIDVAKAAGADAVKFQTFKAEESTSFSAEKAEYQKQTTSKNNRRKQPPKTNEPASHLLIESSTAFLGFFAEHYQWILETSQGLQQSAGNRCRQGRELPLLFRTCSSAFRCGSRCRLHFPCRLRCLPDL